MARRAESEAVAFLIWREGTSVAWDCTVSELADAVGLPRRFVQETCNERAWPVQPQDDAGEPPGADRLMHRE